MADSVRGALTAQISPRPRLNLALWQKTFLFATPLLAGLALRVALDALTNAPPGLSHAGRYLFGFALIPTMFLLLIYALRTKEVLVEAKPKLSQSFRHSIIDLLGDLWKTASLTGWTLRTPYHFGKLLLERTGLDKR
jgi:hypothetical protein